MTFWEEILNEEPQIVAAVMSFKKHSPIERHYRDYKYLDQNLT